MKTALRARSWALIHWCQMICLTWYPLKLCWGFVCVRTVLFFFPFNFLFLLWHKHMNSINKYICAWFLCCNWKKKFLGLKSISSQFILLYFSTAVWFPPQIKWVMLSTLLCVDCLVILSRVQGIAAVLTIIALIPYILDPYIKHNLYLFYSLWVIFVLLKINSFLFQ